MNMELRNDALWLIEKLHTGSRTQCDAPLRGRSLEIVAKLKSGDANWNNDPIADQFYAVLRNALKEVISAVGAYHMPDGIGPRTFASRVISATDNPKFNAAWLYEKSTQVFSNGPESAEDVLTIASKLVTGNRQESHGDMFDSFSQVARMWSAMLNGRDLTENPLKPHEVCDMMELLKMTRSTMGNFNNDDYVDRAGYAACAFECRKRETGKDG